MIRTRILLTCALLGTVAGVAQAELQRIRLDVDDAASIAATLERGGYDVIEGSLRAGSVELVVTSEELAALEGLGLEPTVLERSRPFAEIQHERQEAMGGVPSGYADLAQVYAEMTQAATDHPAICEMVDLTARYNVAPTFEGRHMFAMKISDNVLVDEDEPNFLMVSNHHCREIVTPVIALYAIERLTDDYGIDQQVTDAVDSHEIWIAPTWNPDGYNWVFVGENLWRKNRRDFGATIGVDLNRNYPFGWDGACSGNTNPDSITYKGPSAASEAETQTMLAFAGERHFEKIIDYHSSGREVLYGYASCETHPLETFLEQEAFDIAVAAEYFIDNTRPPSASGEHYQTPLSVTGAYAFLMETSTEFQPPFTEAESEAQQIWPSTLLMLERETSVYGHVTDALTGDPLIANVDVLDLTFQNGETNLSGGQFSRYHVFLPDGSYTLEFSATGYVSQTHVVNVADLGDTLLDVALVPEGAGVVLPDDFEVIFGAYTSGVLGDLFASDDAYVEIEQRPAFSPQLPLIRMTALGTSGIATPSELRLRIESAATALPATVPQRLEMFNYASNMFNVVDTRTTSFTDETVEVIISVNADRYIEAGTGEVQTRLNWLNPGDVFSPAWGSRVDLINWVISP